MDKPTIFIGSSSEGLDVARAIKEQFDAEADVDLWNEGVFKLNRSYLESLLRAVNLYDFAILVLTPDDVITSRGTTHAAPRDNVIFEHGLFLGRIGPNRAFIVCEESIKLLSDFAGITVATYRKRDDANLLSAVSTACNQIRNLIREQTERSEISLLPSTALAIGYHENFIKKVVSALQERKNIKMKVKPSEPKGKEKVIPLTYDDFVLHVIIPNDLAVVVPDALKPRVTRLVNIALSTPFRDFPFYIRAKDQLPGPKGSKNLSKLELFDIPTTLLASREAIDLILKDSFLGRSKDREKLERREIRNFEKTLRILIERTYGKDHTYLQLGEIDYLESV